VTRLKWYLHIKDSVVYCCDRVWRESLMRRLWSCWKLHKVWVTDISSQVLLMWC